MVCSIEKIDYSSALTSLSVPLTSHEGVSGPRRHRFHGSEGPAEWTMSSVVIPGATTVGEGVEDVVVGDVLSLCPLQTLLHFLTKNKRRSSKSIQL